MGNSEICRSIVLVLKDGELAVHNAGLWCLVFSFLPWSGVEKMPLYRTGLYSECANKCCTAIKLVHVFVSCHCVGYFKIGRHSDYLYKVSCGMSKLCNKLT